MRLVAITLLLLGFAAPSRAEIAIGTNLTVLLDFEAKPSHSSLDEMKKEVGHLLRRTGVRIDLKLRSETPPHQDFEDVVLMRFRGACQMSNMAPLIDERGPLAWSHTVEGEILPFGDVACDKIRRAVEGALWGGQRNRKDELFGRALARVVAHELYHIIGGTHTHGKKGVAQPALSGQELIADNIEIESEDVSRMLARMRARETGRRTAASR